MPYQQARRRNSSYIDRFGRFGRFALGFGFGSATRRITGALLDSGLTESRARPPA